MKSGASVLLSVMEWNSLGISISRFVSRSCGVQMPVLLWWHASRPAKGGMAIATLVKSLVCYV